MKSVVSEEEDDKNKNRAKIILATMLVQTKDLQGAEQFANDILSNDDKNVEALRLRASIKLSRKEYPAATEDILSALNQTPNDARLHSILAVIYERNGSAIWLKNSMLRQ